MRNPLTRHCVLFFMAAAFAISAFAAPTDVQFFDHHGNLLTDCTIQVEKLGPNPSREILPPSSSGSYTTELEPGQKVVFRAFDPQNTWYPGSHRVPVDLQSPLQVTLFQVQSQHTCAEAVAIGVPSVTPFDTTGVGSDESIAGLQCGSASIGLGDGLWYEVLGTGNTMTASTCQDAGFDTQIAVVCADSCLGCEQLTCIAGNDDGNLCGTTFTSEVSWPSTAGLPYLIYVTGFSSVGGVDSGAGNLTISDDGFPANAPPTCLVVECEDPTGACCTCLNSPDNCMIASQAECENMNANLPGATLGYLGDGVPCRALGPNAFDYIVNPGTPIPDGTGANQQSGLQASALIDVADDFIVGDLNVDFQTAHTWASDLQVSLRSPNGTEVVLSSRWCNGTAVGPFPGMDVVYDGDSTTSGSSLCIGGSAIVGTANTDDTQGGLGNPTGSLDQFDGEQAAGTWALLVEDLFAGDTGAIDRFSLHFTDSVSNCPVISGSGTGDPTGGGDDEDEDSEDSDSSGSADATAEGANPEGDNDGLLGLGLNGEVKPNTTSDTRSRVGRRSGRDR